MNEKVRDVLLGLFYAAILSAALFVIAVQWRKSEGTTKKQIPKDENSLSAATNINSRNLRVLDYASYATTATNSDYWSTSVAVYFSPLGTVDRVSNYGLKDGKVFDYVKQQTPTVARDEGIIKALFRNLGTKQLGLE